MKNQTSMRRRPLISERGYGGRQAPEHPDDRPERSTPHHLPHGYHTEEELAEFIQESRPEKKAMSTNLDHQTGEAEEGT